MERIWFFIDNQFLNVTARNFKRAVKLSNYHDAALKKLSLELPVNPDIVALYNRYHTAHLQLVADYNAWKAAGGTQEGETLNVTLNLKLLLKKVKRWEAQVLLVYDPDTPRYKAIFPNGRSPFGSTKSIQERIDAVNALSIAIGTDAALAATKAEVDAYYITLDDSRDTQESSKATTKGGSNAVNASRMEAMKLQYSDVGYFIYNWYQNPIDIAPLFDLDTLRENRQSIFTGTLTPNENKAVVTRTLLADDDLVLEVFGTGTAKVYLATTANGTDSTPVTVTGDAAKLNITAAAFGITDYGTHRYITIVNQSGTETLHFKITLK